MGLGGGITASSFRSGGGGRRQRSKPRPAERPTRVVNGQTRAYAQPRDQTSPWGGTPMGSSQTASPMMFGAAQPRRGSPGGGSGGGGRGGGFGGGGGGFGGGFGGGGFGGGGGGFGGGGGWNGQPVDIKSEQSPQLAELADMWKRQQADIMTQANATDQNLQDQISVYKERMGEGPTTRAIERASSTIRDFAAGQAQNAMTRAAQQGRGQGFGATGIAESAGRNQARAASDIALGREGQLDRLFAAGQRTMEAPGRQKQGYYGMGSNFFGQAPQGQQANYMLGSQQLGLDAAGLGLEAQNQAYNQSQNWYNMLFG